MEKWITRAVAATRAPAAASRLFWTFGVFLAVPWGESRMLVAEQHRVAGSRHSRYSLGMAVTWGALHILAIADRDAGSSTALLRDLRAADDRFGTGRSRRHGVEHRARRRFRIA
jgi:hypothetical protein